LSSILTKKLANNEIKDTDAYLCIGFMTRNEYMSTLSKIDGVRLFGY